MKIIYLLIFAIFALLVGVPSLDAEDLEGNLGLIENYNEFNELYTHLNVHGDGQARDVTITGNYAYVAYRGDGLVIINIEDPTNPTLVGRYDTNGYALGISISGNYAYIADGSRGLVIINIEDPTNPTLVGSYDTDGYAWSVSI